MPDPVSVPGRTLSRGWRVVLVISLALNLLVAGAAVGLYAKHGGKSGGALSRYERIGSPLARALSETDRREIRDQMRQTLRGTAEDRAAKRAHYEALIRDLRAGSFDRDAMAVHLARQRDMLVARMAHGQDLLLERIARMSAEERVALADRIERILDREDARR